MASVLDIWNLALARIGESASIADPDERSEPARWCRVAYPIARDACLQAHDWDFARRVYRAPELSGISALPPWSYVLAYPPACLSIRGYFLGDAAKLGEVDARAEPAFVVSSPAGTLKTVGANWPSLIARPQPFQVAGETDGEGRDIRYVLVEAGGGFFRYTRRADDVALYSPAFMDALAWRLAADLAQSMARGRELRSDAMQMCGRALDQAAVVSSRQERISPAESPTLLARA